MPSNHVSNINIPVTVTKVSERDLKEVQKKQEEQAALLRARSSGADTLNIEVSKTPTASAGEAPSPSQNEKTSHNQLKQARHGLEKALKSANKALSGNAKGAGTLKTQSQDLVGEAREKLGALDESIHKLATKNGNSQELKTLQDERYQLTEALETYEAVQFETTAVDSSSDALFQGAGSQTSPELLTAQDEFATTAKSLGVEVSGSEIQVGDIEAIQTKIVTQVKEELKVLGEQEKDLKTKLLALEGKLKTASGPEKEKLETQKKELQAQLQQTTLKIQSYKESLTKLSTVTDAILRLQISKDLGTPQPTTLRSQSVSGLTLKEEKKPETASRSFASTAATPAATSGRSSGAATLTTASAGADAAATDDVGGASGGGGAVGDTGVEGLSPSAQSAGSDFTGTSYAIGAAGNNLRSEARRTDKMIKKLLAAVMSGNMEAVTHALIFLDKRASLITIGIGAQTIKAMQSYEKQMSALNNQIGKLKGNEPDYNAKLAKLNSEMNQASLNRQSISNFLRDTLNMREEIGNTTHGMITKRGQIQSQLSRFGG